MRELQTITLTKKDLYPLGDFVVMHYRNHITSAHLSLKVEPVPSKEKDGLYQIKADF